MRHNFHKQFSSFKLRVRDNVSGRLLPLEMFPHHRLYILEFVVGGRNKFRRQSAVCTGNWELMSPRSPEGTHAKVGENQGKASCQRGFGQSFPARGVAMIPAEGRTAANHGKHQEEQAGYFQPERVQHMPDAAQGGGTGFVESPYQAVLAALASRDAEKGPALSTEIAG